MQPVLDIRGLHKHYRTGSQDIHALRGVWVSVRAGEFLAIMGASGSGKSTLLHLAGGLDLPDAGTVWIEGKNLAGMSDRQRTLFRRRRLGIVFQDYNLLPSLTARENMVLPLLLDAVPSRQIRRRADELISLVHLEHRASHRPDAMSGGERQRVAIGRALLNDPAVILADEPTGNLDSTDSQEIWQLLRRLAHELAKTVLMVTHEPAGAAYADRIHVLRDGQFVGTIEPTRTADATLVSSRYQELAR
ncbi:MAG: ABC transporter ATP-binding protein [Phycisphaerae bacterium]